MKTLYSKIISTVLIFLLGAVISGNGQTAADSLQSGSSPKDENAKRIAEQLFEAFNRHDIEKLAGLYAESIFADSPDYPNPKRNPAEIKDYYQKMFLQSPDVHDEVINMMDCGNRVFVEFISTGTIQNPGAEMPASTKGKKFKLKIATILEIQDGKIVRDVSYFDQLSILKQLGLMPE